MYIFASGFFTGLAMLRLFILAIPNYTIKWDTGLFLIDVLIAFVFLLYGITEKKGKINV
jgi:hypothetical protein